MRVVIPRSEVVTDETGWTWLQPVASSTRARHTVGTFFLALAILLGGAAWTLLPRPASVLATAAVTAAGLWLLWGIVRGAGSRIALSDLGLYVQDGGRAAQVGWAAIRGISAAPMGRRWRISIDDGYQQRTTRTGFDVQVAREWLAHATAEAARRQLAPVALPDGAGFTSGVS